MREVYRKEKRRGKVRSFFMSIVKVITVLIAYTLIAVIVGAGYLFYQLKPVYDGYAKAASEKMENVDENTFKDKLETGIYDKEGELFKKLAVHDYHYIDYKDIKDDIKDVLISIEDVRYYEHEGFDMRAIARAGYEVVRNKGKAVQGGSTITQQLVKLQFLTLEKDYGRKLEEVLIAHKMEDMFDKEEILEFYLNNINYGNGAYGIETASRHYFSKESKELTLEEIAFLTAIPNNPTYYNPLRNKDNTLDRKDLILRVMRDQEKISEKEYLEAKEVEIVLDVAEKTYVPESYAVSFAVHGAAEELMREQGFEFKYWFDSEEERKSYKDEYNDLLGQLSKKIRNGGYNIYTTLDMEKQQELQKKLNEGLSYFTEKDEESKLYKTQGSSVTIDNETGDVVAVVGGRTQKDVDNTYNRAILSSRQPGSTIKPIVSYAPAFDEGLLASTIMVDEAVDKGPQNYGRNYRGKMTLREALVRSTNIIAYKLVDRLSTEKSLGYLEKLEYSDLSPKDDHLGISIGGFTYGTNVMEMAGAYSSLARNGEFIRPTGIERIEDVSGILYKNTREKKRIYDSGSAYLTTDILKDVITEDYGTGRGLGLGNMSVAGKTGTTNNNKDSWFAGYTPYYTTVVWVGNDMPAPITNLKGSASAGGMWKKYMLQIHEGLDERDFEMPERISYMYINPKNGDVSKEKKKGWRKELVTEIYYEKKEKEKEEARLEALRKEKERKKKEEERIKKEEERLAEQEKERLKERAKLLKSHGITEAEEMLREENALSLLNKLKAYKVLNEEEDEDLIILVKNVREAIQDIVIHEVRNDYYNQYEAEVGRVEGRKSEIQENRKREEAEKLAEKEMLEKEMLEKERLEEEKRKEEELKEKELKEEEDRKREEEEKRLEEERLEKEEQEREEAEELDKEEKDKEEGNEGLEEGDSGESKGEDEVTETGVR